VTPAEAARLLAGLAPRAQGAEPVHLLGLSVLLLLQGSGELGTNEVLAALDLPSAGTLTPYLQALQAAGYIERRRHPFDHRRTLCQITPKGLQLLRSARRPLSSTPTVLTSEQVGGVGGDDA